MINFGRNVKNCLDYYGGDYAEEQGLKSLSTIISCCHHLEKFMGEKNIRDLSIDDIRKYKRVRRRKDNAAPNTIGRELGILSAALNICVDEGIIKARNEIRLIEKLKIKKPPMTKRKVVPLFSEFDEIMKHLPAYLVKFAHGLKFTAFRRGELEQLKFADIDFYNKEIRLNETKTEQPRNTGMYRELFEHMENQRNDAREIFEKENVNDIHVYREPDGKLPIVRSNTYYTWRKANLAAGCTVVKNHKEYPKYTWHDLRKHAIKYLSLKKGFDRYIIISMFSGHASIDIFEKTYNIPTADDYRINMEKVLAA